MAKPHDCTITKLIHGTPEVIWKTFTDPDSYNVVHSTVNTTIDLREGGRIETGPDYASGKGEAFVFGEIEPPHHLIYSWEDAPGTPIEVEITPGETASEVRITQHGIEHAEWNEHQRYAWTWVLDSIESFVTSGKGVDHDSWWREHVPEHLRNLFAELEFPAKSHH